MSGQVRTQSPSIGVNVQPRRPQRQDTFDLRDQIGPEIGSRGGGELHQYHPGDTSDEEHSMLDEEDDGQIGDGEFLEELEETSSSLSIPNESIDFDLVYAFHSFAATVEGQANVVKGDSLRLMDDSNSYWWLVSVLNTQEIGYIPAENIETPLERLARLNKHRNVDLASATQIERQEDNRRERQLIRGAGTPQPKGRGIAWDESNTVHNYPPAIWRSDDEDDEDEYYDEEDDGEDVIEFEDEEEMDVQTEPAAQHSRMDSEDDGISWDEDAAAQQQQARMRERQQQQQQQQLLQQSQQQQSQQQQLLVESNNTAATPVQTRQNVQQQQQQQQQPQQQQQAQLGLGQPTSALRPQTSRERLIAQQQSLAIQQIQGQGQLDPAEATETKRITLSPTIVRDRPAVLQAGPGGIGASLSPTSPSEYSPQQTLSSPKRGREGEEEDPLSKRKRDNRPVSNDPRAASGAKLRKDPQREEENGAEKKKKGGMLSSIFGRSKKEKSGKSDNGISEKDRRSEDSGGRPSSSGHSGGGSPSEVSAPGSSPVSGISPTQQSSVFNTPPRQSSISDPNFRNSTDPRRAQPTNGQTQQVNISPMSQHTLKMQQADQAQQALYQQQHLSRAPGSHENTALAPSYGLQSASAFLPGSVGQSTPTLKTQTTPEKQRPGSLILSPTTFEMGVPVPELTVMRVFAGAGIQTEATFKTVLLNGSTTAQGLVRQAMQRFRLAAGEDPEDYYLTVKQLEGSSAELKMGEKPLLVFEGLVEASLPRVNRNSVGSISSITSNLSMHPAIRKLPMNDFTDDSAVKFYLNRRGADEATADRNVGDAGDNRPSLKVDELAGSHSATHLKPPSGLSVSVHPAVLTPERFSSPSVRFPLQLVIFPEDLPDGMVFDPLTEAIIPKAALRERSNSGSTPGISQHKRRKILIFPKNTTVAEVIELGLERFGIPDGVVDGGDEVEDKTTKRRSFSRVRYGLSIHVEGQERRLLPTSKVLEAFPKTPVFREVDRRSTDSKRRSVDSSMLLGLADDIQPNDPMFVLRRVNTYRLSGSSNRLSAPPLDEIGLLRLHRDSAQMLDDDQGKQQAKVEQTKPEIRVESAQMSTQELIAAQRAASRANQKALLSANSNSQHGVDILLPDKALLRSSQYEDGDKMRYSYVEPDGGTYDISEIIEEELRSPTRTTAPGKDLLDGVLAKDSNKLNRVLNKIKDNKGEKISQTPSQSSTSTAEPVISATSSTGSSYTDETIPPRDRKASLQLGTIPPQAPPPQHSPPAAPASTPASEPIARVISPPIDRPSRLTPVQSVESLKDTAPPIRDVVSPVQRAKSPPGDSQGRASPVDLLAAAARAVSPTNPHASRDPTPISRYATPTGNASISSRTTTPVQPGQHQRTPTPSSMPNIKTELPSLISKPKKPLIPNDDFGFDNMWAIVEVTAMLQRPPSPEPLDPVELKLFGPKVNMDKLHPAVKEVYGDVIDEMAKIDKELDDLMLKVSKRRKKRDVSTTT